MKHYKDAIIHGAQLFRQLQGHQASDNEVAKLPIVASSVAARALSQRRAADGDDEDDFFSDFSFAFGSGEGGGDDESGGDFDILSAFGGFGGGEGGDDESGGGFDFLSAFGGFGGGGGEDEDESGGGDLDFFSTALGGMGMGSGEDEDMDELMENMEQCGIDVEDMATKAYGAFFHFMMMSGGGMDFASPESIQTIAPILLELKDDDEVNCEDTESAQMVVAFEEYLKCSGMDQFFDPMNFEDTESIDTFKLIDACQPVMDTFYSGDRFFDLEEEDILDENSDFAKSSKICAQTLLGDNLLGNFIRYQYDNLDKTFSCFGSLSEELPHCILSSPPSDDGTTYSFPLSLEKKMVCVVGSSYESMLDEACTGIYEGLDKCLPQTDVTNVDEAIEECAEEEGLVLGKLDVIGMDASVLTSNRMPAFCYKIFEDKKMDLTELQARLDHYNEHREYGWTLESIASDAAPKIEASEQPEETYVSKPFNIASVESVEWDDDESSDSASGEAKFFPFLIAGAVIVGAVTLALIVKHARSKFGGTRSQSNPKTNTSRKEYAHVAVKAMDFA